MLRTDPNAINRLKEKRSMVWHYILLVILLLISVFNFFYGSRITGGKHYGSSAEMEAVYFYFPGMKIVDPVFGWFCVALATLGFVLVYLLYRKKKQSLILLPLLFALNAAGQVLYLVADIVVMSKDAGDTAGAIKESLGQMFFSGALVQVIVTLAVSAVMIVFNRIYYDKRKDLFS